MALGGPGGEDAGGLSATSRHVSVGGSRDAPRKLMEGCRWIGGQVAEIDGPLIQKCTEGMEAGKILDLNFQFKFLQGISGLEQVAANLRSLDLSSNNVQQIEGLKGMAKLRELKLYGCQIARIQNLESCVSLASLHLQDNLINAIEGLDHLKFLEYLNLEGNRILKIGRSLARLTKLRELQLSRNKLQSLEGLTSLTALEVLCVNQNQIKQVTAELLRGLAKLDDFQIGGNQLQSLSFLAGSDKPGAPQCVRNLATLDASGNRLSAKALRNLPPLLQLIELNLSDNEIEGIPEEIERTFPSVEILDLARNRLEKIQDVEMLRPLVSIRELTLQDNPVCSMGEELQRALAGLASLEYFDDRPLGKKESGDDDPATFRLTHTKMGDSLTSRPDTGSRPSTGSSRPGTAQGMKEAGIRDPLMHAHVKLSDRRFVSAEQATIWEKQTMSSLAAIEQQIRKTEQEAESELKAMDAYLHKAQMLFNRERELRAKGGISARPAPVPEEPAEPRWDKPPEPSRFKQRLKAAMSRAMNEEEDGGGEDDLGPGPSSSASSRLAPSSMNLPPRYKLLSAYDEEVVDEDAVSQCSHAPRLDSDAEAAEISEEEIAAATMSDPDYARPAAAVALEKFRTTTAVRTTKRALVTGSRPPRAPPRSR